MLARKARRRANDTSTGEKREPALRYTASVGVDIPYRSFHIHGTTSAEKGALMRSTHLALPLFFLAMLLITLPATAQDLPDGAEVRIQSSQLHPGWHEGTVQITKEGCVLVWKPAPEVFGRGLGLGLMFIQKLERKDGGKWIELPVAPMIKKEPKTC
jgi:hypothetical protein